MKFDVTAFLEIWKSKHVGHEALLLTIATRDTEDVLAVVSLSQKEMTEIIMPVLDKTVIAQSIAAL